MLPAGERIQRITSKQAKKAYSKRGGQLSDKQKRQIAREVELDKRADAIRQKELRKKELARQRADKEAQQRESRKNVAGPVDEGYVSPRQTRMEGFFRNPTSRCVSAAASPVKLNPGSGVNERCVSEPKELCSRNEDSARVGKDAVVHLISPQDEAREEPELPEMKIKNTSEEHLEPVLSVQGGLDPQPGTVGNNLPVAALDRRRKRKALSRASSGVSCYTQPVRMPLRLVDPNVHIDKDEIWIPPSQNTVHSKKRLNCTIAPKGPLPTSELARVPSASHTRACLVPKDPTIDRDADEEAPSVPCLIQKEPSHLNVADLPQMLTKSGEIDSEIFNLAELLSSDPVFDIDKMPPPTQSRPLLQAPKAISEAEPAQEEEEDSPVLAGMIDSAEIKASEDPPTEGQLEVVDSILADLTSSQFSSFRLSQNSFKLPSEADAVEAQDYQPENQADIASQASDETVPFSDPFDLSMEEAQALESAAAAAAAADAHSTPRSTLRMSLGAEKHIDRDVTPRGPTLTKTTDLKEVDGEQDEQLKQSEVGESFGFGDFDFTSQDFRVLDR